MFNEEIIMYDYALKINPNEYSAYYNKGKRLFKYILGVALANLGKFDEEIKLYDHVLKIFPNTAKIYYMKGKWLKFILGVAL